MSERPRFAARVRRTVGSPRESFVKFPMKHPSLCPYLLSATLFLCTGLRGEQGKTEGSPVAPEAEGDHAKRRRAEAVAGELARRQALRTELIKLFDKNGDGKLDETEMAAVSEFLMKGSVPPTAPQTAANEQARLERIADEVAKRRAVREAAAKAKQGGGGK